MPRTTPLKLSAGGGVTIDAPTIGQPYLFQVIASAGDTGVPAAVNAGPSLEITRPDGSRVDGPIDFIPIRVTGTLDLRTDRPLDEQSLEAQWLLPASLTATFPPGVYIATVRWAGNSVTRELEFAPPTDPAKSVWLGAMTLCEAGESKRDPRLMMSGLDAGFAVRPRDVVLSLCLADALKMQGNGRAARDVIESLPPGSIAPRGAFEFLFDETGDEGSP